MSVRLALLTLFTLSACARVDYQPVDLQLDVLGELPEEAATLHVCVEGAGEHSQGAGNGRGVFFGIPEGLVVVLIDVLDEQGAVLATAGPVAFEDGETYATTPLEEGGRVCHDDGDVVPEGEPSQVLGYRIGEY